MEAADNVISLVHRYNSLRRHMTIVLFVNLVGPEQQVAKPVATFYNLPESLSRGHAEAQTEVQQPC